jgi:hypothetical protein
MLKKCKKIYLFINEINIKKVYYLHFMSFYIILKRIEVKNDN